MGTFFKRSIMGAFEGKMKITIAMKTPNINYFDTRLLDESQQLYLFIS